jgi:hypothetical protein
MKLSQISNADRHLFSALLLSFVLMLASAPLDSTFGQGKVLDLKFHRQNTQVWCWAASIAMVVEYLKGTPIEDCEVLSLYDRQFNGPGMCCQGDRRCQRGSMPGEIAPILGNIFDVHGRVLERGLSWNEVVANIDDDKPIIAWVWNSPTSAHVVVIVGYARPNTLVVFDPMAGRLNLPFDRGATNWGPQHNWNISWIFTTNKVGGDGGGGSTPRVERRIECQHRVACAHTMPCGHRMACPHRIPCQHPIYGPYGVVPAHPFDTLHPFDTAHQFDTQHQFDTLHPFDVVTSLRAPTLFDPSNPESSVDSDLSFVLGL